MKRSAIIIAALLLCGCDRPLHQPDDYRHWTDRWIARLWLQNIGIEPCRREPLIEQCYKLEPARRWRGTWTLGPGEEDAPFCPGANTSCRADKQPKYGLAWKPGLRRQVQAEWGKTYVLDFIGRRTANASIGFGWGRTQYLIVVDRVISTRQLPGRSTK